VHAAGQISYYSNRYAIDLLGKNDPVIAQSPPSTAFRPGHNKWDYDYSISNLKPDLIADEWGNLRDYFEKQTDEEYTRLPNGIWVLMDSELVNKSILSASYRH
jgi:hypothetical protein